MRGGGRRAYRVPAVPLSPTPAGPACRRHASAQVDEGLLRNVDAEGADGQQDRCRFVRLGFHTVLLCCGAFPIARSSPRPTRDRTIEPRQSPLTPAPLTPRRPS